MEGYDTQISEIFRILMNILKKITFLSTEGKPPKQIVSLND